MPVLAGKTGHFRSNPERQQPQDIVCWKSWQGRSWGHHPAERRQRQRARSARCRRGPSVPGHCGHCGHPGPAQPGSARPSPASCSHGGIPCPPSNPAQQRFTPLHFPRSFFHCCHLRDPCKSRPKGRFRANLLLLGLQFFRSLLARSWRESNMTIFLTEGVELFSSSTQRAHLFY